VSDPDDLELETPGDDEPSRDGRAQRMVIELGPRWRERSTPSRGFIASAGVAALVVIAGAVLAWSTGGDSAVGAPPVPARTPSVVPAPSTSASLPYIPVEPKLSWAGATPSAPLVGELVAAAAQLHVGAWYVYADGRLISLREPVPSHGWSEQRLTSAGVERVRAEFLSTGLFEPGQPHREIVANRAPFPIVQVRDGRNLVSAQFASNWDAHTHPEVRRLVNYLLNLESLLPPDAWVDQRTEEYVPPRYSFCVSSATTTSTYDVLPDASIALQLLPTRVAELLVGHPTNELRSLGGTCFEVTRQEAGALARHFGLSGWQFDVTEPVPMTVTLAMWGLLPHRVPTVWGG
jgi:hypothetical protein